MQPAVPICLHSELVLGVRSLLRILWWPSLTCCLQVLGQQQALHAVFKEPELLAVDTVQPNIALMRLCGVADPPAVALNNVGMLRCDWLAQGRLANRLALQRCTGLSAAGVYERFGGYLDKAPKRMVGRLLYLEHRSLQHLLVADKLEARLVWRQQRGLPASKRAAGEPAFISVGDVATLSDERFSSHDKLCDGAADFAAFQEGLLESPAWLQQWAAAEAEVALLRSQLPPEVRPGDAARRRSRRRM